MKRRDEISLNTVEAQTLARILFRVRSDQADPGLA